MATVKFQLIGKTEQVSIYITLSFGRGNTFKKNTGYKISPKDWSKDKNRPKQTIAELKSLKTSLDDLENNLYHSLNSAIEKNEIINAQWLQKELDRIQGKQTKEVINKNLFLTFFKLYIEKLPHKITQKGKKGVATGTIKRFNNVFKIITEYEIYRNERILIRDIDHNFQNQLTTYLTEEKQYSVNYSGTVIKSIKTVCRDAKLHGIETSPNLDRLKGFTDSITIVVLSETELQQIHNTEYRTDYLENAKDWLMIGCYLGQRVSDLLKLTNKNITVQNTNELISLKQQKTGKHILIPIHPIVKEILEKRNNEFPRKISDQRFNDYIKQVARIAGINEKIEGAKLNPETVRKKSGIFPKWELISSHVCRRSFATNFYGNIPTPLLISITGHSTEKQFLEYIGKSANDSAIQLAEYWTKQAIENKKQPHLNVIKKAN